MRLLDNARFSVSFKFVGAIGLTFALGACALPGMGSADIAPSAQAAPAANGPAADYPMVLGDPYTVNGELYTPADTLNYDEVGYAAADVMGGQGITAAHRTLPLPSYVEVTSLQSGKTILVRLERRGPMTGSDLIALSPAAQAQLGLNASGPVRVRRTNPPEIERAELRAGGFVQPRLETPPSLAQVLRDRLPASGSASLRSAEAPPIPSTISPGSPPVRSVQNTAVPPSAAATAAPELPALAQSATPARVTRAPQVVSSGPAAAPTRGAAAATPARAANPIRPSARQALPSFDQAFADSRSASTAYPLAPLTGAAPFRSASAVPVAPPVSGRLSERPQSARPAPVVVSALPTPRAARPAQALAQQTAPQAASRAAAPPQATSQAPAQATGGRFVIQAGSFSSRSNAVRVADGIDGFVEQAGQYYRVRTGPYTTRGQAEAELAKVRAAGYSDARVFTSG